MTTTSPPMTRRPLRWLGAVLLLLPVARGAAQGQDAVRVHVSVEAAAQCATPVAIAAQVHKRSQRIEFVADTSDVPLLHVTIGAGEGGDRVAELALIWPDGRRSERRLSAASCAAAVDALALVVAMTLDPAAFQGARADAERGEPGGRGAESGSESESEPETETATDSESGAGSESESGSGSDTESESATSTATSTESASPSQSLSLFGVAQFAGGASAHLVSGPAPHAMAGVGLYARLAFNGAGVWFPSLELQLTHAWVDGLSEPGGTAGFALDLAELDVCPVGVQLEPFAAQACLASAIGRLSADGTNSYAPKEHDELWASLGGALLLSVRIARRLELQGGLGVTAPLRRYQFAFAPDVFYRVPKVDLEAHLGAGLRFP